MIEDYTEDLFVECKELCIGIYIYIYITIKPKKEVTFYRSCYYLYKFLQFDWPRAVVFQLNLKYL